MAANGGARLALMALVVLLAASLATAILPNNYVTYDTGVQREQFKLQLNKKAWPELTRLEVSSAQRIIHEENPNLVVQVVTPGMLVTKDFRPNRVRIYVDDQGKVQRAPSVG